MLVAFCGYANAGKDEAARGLGPGWIRRNFGDRIKYELDPLIRPYFGFSAYTEDRYEKARIRSILEQWGECRYEEILKNYLADVRNLLALSQCVVNTRLVRVREAQAWRDLGGVIVAVIRNGNPPATDWERDRFNELTSAVKIDAVVENKGSVEELHRRTKEVISCLADSRVTSPSVSQVSGNLAGLTPRPVGSGCAK